MNLTYCQQIADASIEALAAGCPQLTSVNLTACNQITGASVAALRSQIPGVNVSQTLLKFSTDSLATSRR